ncbi:hypothetical protein Lal_00020394 [Lupinus albus]|uniref:Prostaglandin E synthase 2 n=1 Tax=Lupinus albus TaxID=3870 RepID=A0A6A5MJP8_LUPAL|nr:putative prostaglandin-E synthase [Lupinus albus]KAF1871600.1 hypothetical protein Lal_00020394 [Lupinus albus]
MIRVNSRAILVGRALLNNSTTISGAVSGGATINRVIPFATCSTSNHQSRNLVGRFGLSNPFLAQCSYAAVATSLAQDIQAKGLPHSENEGFNPKEVVLFQYEACPFCNKVKAFLDYYDLPYRVVEVNPMNKKEIKWSDYKKVPILTVDGEQMVDSSDIINKLVIKIRPDYDLNADEEKKWREWVDNHLVHVLSPNIYRTVAEALESFEYITTQGNFSLYERLVAKYGGAAAMYFVSKKLKKRHNITDERAALYGAAEQWVDALNGRKFLGGLNPNLADLAVFGVLRPIRHLKSGRDMVEHTRIGKWFSDMDLAVGQSSRVIANN